MTLDCQALVHLLHNLEYTGWPYHGSYSQFQQELNDYIGRYKDWISRGRGDCCEQTRRVFTLEEDKKILRSDDLHKMAEALGRKYNSVIRRKELLDERRGMPPKGKRIRRPWTPYEDEIILKTDNLHGTAELLKRNYKRVSERRARLRRRAHVRPTVHKPSE